ncbi:hypothetical protein I9W82_003248 [Candida metapsilosis]|uniref:Mediator of RNA polymerase II transcription subunit 9 n=1 Tax=Candida metapsilosis TaxID=273372 RepID=A0A8H8DD50_9ASCO|nr:hypothetical protein I9W82_003248 [Candida metapsilosis]
MDTPIGLEGTIGSDYSIENQDDLARFSQLESVGGYSEQESTTVQLPDPKSSSVSPEINYETNKDLLESQQNASRSEKDVYESTPAVAETDSMDISRDEIGAPLSESLEPAYQATPTTKMTNDVTNQSDDPLSKIKQVQLLPELYDILFNFTSGSIHPRDFDKHIGNLRSKLNNLKSYISEIEGIDVTPEMMMNDINRLKENNAKKQNLINTFRDKVRNEFM